MAYNKAREERKWRIWKEAEEKQLRSLGVSEDDIEKLRVRSPRFLRYVSTQKHSKISNCILAIVISNSSILREPYHIDPKALQGWKQALRLSARG